MTGLSWFALIVFAVAIIGVISNIVDGTVAALLGVAVMVWFGVMTEVDAFQLVDWNVMAIGCAVRLGAETGAFEASRYDSYRVLLEELDSLPEEWE